jgi:peptidoglycan/xylan/chitin deacetylase (PgdA/CDA1 family)
VLALLLVASISTAAAAGERDEPALMAPRSEPAGLMTGEPAASFAPAVAARVVTSGRRSIGAVALTFDDGLKVGACRRISDILRKRKSIGTFFINGYHLQSQPRKWRRVLKGMPVGNHTRSHPNLTTQSDLVVSKQIRENEAIHEKVLRKPMVKMLRPPYGAYDSRTLRIAGALGYRRVVLWSVDTLDWRSTSSASEIASRAMGAPPGAVILMHCSRTATVKALPSIIRHYKRRGIQLAGLRKVLRP